MTTKSTRVAEVIQSAEQAAHTHHPLEPLIADAIRERRVLSITYADAFEPQMFAPLALYVSPAKRLLVDGYEVSGKRVRWREVEVATARHVASTEHTYVLDASSSPTRKTYPYGTTVLATAAQCSASAGPSQLPPSAPAAG